MKSSGSKRLTTANLREIYSQVKNFVNQRVDIPRHIECRSDIRKPLDDMDTDRQNLVIPGAAKLVKAGYVPYLVRNVRKTRCARDSAERSNIHLGYRKGWQTYGNHNALKVLDDDSIMFNDSAPDCELDDSLFTSFPHVFIQGNLDSSKEGSVAWFSRSKRKLLDWDAKQGRYNRSNGSLRLGIVFSPVQDLSWKPFDFSKAVTNIAEFSINCMWVDTTPYLSFGK